MIMLIFLVIIFSMASSILLLVNMLMSSHSFLQREKKSPFECGFEIFQSMRLPFSIHFFFIAILFLIFDIEIIFFYSMILSNNMLNYKSWFYCSLLILMILIIGLEYEKMEGPLKWMI